MGSIRWIILNALAISLIYAAPRELSTEELITVPRPGEEYVNIQTNTQDKVNLQEQSFTTSHRIPSKKETFETSHKVPPAEIPVAEKFDTAESKIVTNFEDPASTEAVRVVTRTSVKMSKSKKVQKSIGKVPHEVQIDIKADEGTIDETATADPDVKEVMAKKKHHETEEEFQEEKKPLRFNVPFEDEVEVTGKPKFLAVGPASTLKTPTTEAPPITTFNYKNVYNSTKFEIISKKEKIDLDKHKYEVVVGAESRPGQGKKDTKQEKKLKLAKKEEDIKRQDTGYYVLPVNKVSPQISDDNFDFVDLDEKVLETAGSSPGQSSRINIKKGPNGQEYEYVYYYYYYDDDEDGKNSTTGNRVTDEKQETTEKVYNGHDGPALETYEGPKSSTSGARYLPTESPKSRKKTTAEVEEKEEVEQSQERTTRYKNINRQSEASNNEILPVTSRPSARSRGRISNSGGTNSDEIPAIGEERLPANTRFPPRSRGNPQTSPSPPPQETTSRTRNRDSNSQNRVRLPNLGLLDSSSFRTHSSDASIDEDPIYDAELQRRPGSSRTYSTEATDVRRDEITTLSHRRGRPTTSTTTTEKHIEEEEVPVSRRPTSRRPIELAVPKEEEIADGQVSAHAEEEEEVKIDKINGNGRRPETTRESDYEEGDFPATGTPYDGTNDLRKTEATTEDESAVGLTSAMMQKVALDLYAILQQAHDENIQTNFVEGTATDATTEEEQYTEVTTFSTTTTTTPEPTTTTTTTTPAPTTVAAGRGRYRGRGGSGVGLPRSRSKVASTTTTTTELPVEPSSQKPRGRFQPHGSRTSGSRRVTKPKVEVEEEVAPKEEAPKPTVERTFGGRNRFRGGVKPASTTTTTSAPSTASGASAIASRGNSIDRFNSRRRGNRVSISTTSQPIVEENAEAEQHHDGSASTSSDEPTAPAAPKPGTRNRIHAGGVRPLRPGPRVPINLAHRGRLPSTTAAAPVESEDPIVEKEAEPEQPTSQGEEVQEAVSTPVPDALSRLKNRRLRIGPNAARPTQSPVASPVQRKKSPLLPKRRPGEEKPVEKTEEQVDEKQHEEEVYEEEVSPSSAEPSTTTEAQGLPGLLNGRRRNLIRRPGTLYSRSQQQTAATEA